MSHLQGRTDINADQNFCRRNEFASLKNTKNQHGSSIVVRGKLEYFQKH